jgi:hypothetical protein
VCNDRRHFSQASQGGSFAQLFLELGPGAQIVEDAGKVRLVVDDELADRQVNGKQGSIPFAWKAQGSDFYPVAIPRYNNENRWYIEKYQSIVNLFE